MGRPTTIIRSAPPRFPTTLPHHAAPPRCPTTLPYNAALQHFFTTLFICIALNALPKTILRRSHGGFSTTEPAMPHSRRTNKSIERRMQSINTLLKKLAKLHIKHIKNARIINHSSVTLGDLRSHYSSKHKELPEELLKGTDTFERIECDSSRRLYIYGKDGGLIACRVPLNDQGILNTLTESLRELPDRTNHKFRGIDRGDYSTRHYCIWCPYSLVPFVSKELQEDAEAGLEFLKKNTKLWNKMSNVLGQISPSSYKRFMRYPLPKGLPRFCTAWAGCVVNLGRDDPVQTKPHRDVKESIFGFSCVVPAGDYKGGALILYDLKMVIELAPGDMFFFPDSLIHHANEATFGNRSSIVAFTQENLFDYWKRKYNYVNNKAK